MRNSTSAATGTGGDNRRKIMQRAGHELRRFAILFAYLWILFGLFVLNEQIVLRQRGIAFSSQGFALINALVLAKVMLVAEDLNLGRWLGRHPLVYRILHDSLLFTALFIIFHLAEHVIIGIIRGQGVRTSIPTFGGGGLAGLLCVAVILLVSLIPYFAFSHFVRKLGWEKTRALLFEADGGEHRTRNAPPPE